MGQARAGAATAASRDGQRLGHARSAARLRSSSASARQTRSNSARCSPSLAPCARVSGSSTPVTSTDGVGERLVERGDERDRAAHAHVDGLDAVPGLLERGPRRVVRRPGRVDLGRLAVLALGEGELRAPGRVLLEVPAPAGHGARGACRRARAGRETLARADRDQGVAGVGGAGGVEADDGDRRPGPEPLDDRPGADQLDARRRSPDSARSRSSG